MQASADLNPTDFSKTQPFREDWLALAEPEPALDPDLGVIDVHAHLWDRPGGGRYLIEEFARDIEASGHKVEATVYVECGSMYRSSGPEPLRSVGETEFAVGQAAMAATGRYTHSRVAAAIVTFADLTATKELGAVLEAHLAAGGGRVRGVRQRAKWDPHVKGAADSKAPGLFLDPEFLRGMADLVKRDLLFEASVYHPQIPDVVALAHKAPDARIVLNHIGSPLGHGAYVGLQSEVHASWLSGMKALAQCPNVSVKLGGMVMTLAAFDFGRAGRPISSERLAALWRPYIEPCVELFGAERCMASSNFPVDKVACAYGTVWNAFKRMFANYSTDEKRSLLSDAARRIYRL